MPSDSCGMEKNSGYHYGVLQIPLGLNCIALHMGAGVLVDCVWKLQRRKQMRPIVCLLLGCLLFMKVPGWHSPDKLTNCCLETTRLYIVLGYIPVETDWLYQRIQCFSCCQSQSDENILPLAIIVFLWVNPRSNKQPQGYKRTNYCLGCYTIFLRIQCFRCSQSQSNENIRMYNYNR